jgi:hypothetical protein
MRRAPTGPVVVAHVSMSRGDAFAVLILPGEHGALQRAEAALQRTRAALAAVLNFPEVVDDHKIR